MPEQEILLVARSLIAAHGAEALPLAKSSAERMRAAGLFDRYDWWLRVAIAINAENAKAV
jgi:hypothetical protein